MTDFVPLGVMVGLLAYQLYFHHRTVTQLQKERADLLDRLMAKVPEQYFGVRIEEQQAQAAAREAPARRMRSGVQMGPPVYDD